MYLTATQDMLIPHRRVDYSTVSIAAIINTRLHRKYAFHTSVRAFGVAGKVVFEFFGEGINSVLDFQHAQYQFLVASADWQPFAAQLYFCSAECLDLVFCHDI